MPTTTSDCTRCATRLATDSACPTRTRISTTRTWEIAWITPTRRPTICGPGTSTAFVSWKCTDPSIAEEPASSDEPCGIDRMRNGTRTKRRTTRSCKTTTTTTTTLAITLTTRVRSIRICRPNTRLPCRKCITRSKKEAYCKRRRKRRRSNSRKTTTTTKTTTATRSISVKTEGEENGGVSDSIHGVGILFEDSTTALSWRFTFYTQTIESKKTIGGSTAGSAIHVPPKKARYSYE
mmetsp:Transcript_21300/g.46500  ORF Transcript_21300/g.46500 Transcript_21300/m.46500 type:complete len:236 (-) Transcript_21300:508-1215(-)